MDPFICEFTPVVSHSPSVDHHPPQSQTRLSLLVHPPQPPHSPSAPYLSRFVSSRPFTSVERCKVASLILSRGHVLWGPPCCGLAQCSSLLMSGTPRCGQTTSGQFINLTIDVCFYLAAIVNRASVGVRVWDFLWMRVCLSWVYAWGMGWLGHVLPSCRTIGDTAPLLSWAAVSFCHPSSSAGGF